MFEVGFTELLLISVVALLVLGPERLPVAARTLGRGLGQAKRAMTMLRDQVAVSYTHLTLPTTPYV